MGIPCCHWLNLGTRERAHNVSAPLTKDGTWDHGGRNHDGNASGQSILQAETLRAFILVPRHQWERWRQGWRERQRERGGGRRGRGRGQGEVGEEVEGEVDRVGGGRGA